MLETFQQKDYIIMGVVIFIAIMAIVLYMSNKSSFKKELEENVVQINQELNQINHQLNYQLNALSKYRDEMAQNINVRGSVCFNGECLNEKIIKRMNSLYPSDKPYINIVNRRPIFGIGENRNAPVITSTSDANAQQLGPVLYGPLKNVPSPAPGAKRKWRLYATYSDNLGPKRSTQNEDFGFYIKLQVDLPPGKLNLKFMMEGSCGVLKEARDGFSNLIETPMDYTNSGNAFMYGYIDNVNTVRCRATDLAGTNAPEWATPKAAAVEIYYLELQALDVYE